MKIKIIVIVLICSFSAAAYSQDTIPNKLASLFNHQLTIFPQEKIYLHTDKPYYLSGEKIWFRAYLADAITHTPVSESRYVYVELINPLDSVVTRVKIRPIEEAYYGHLNIPADAPQGDYRLRAYTTYMQNVEEDYFFTKILHIGDLIAKSIDEAIPDPAPDHDFEVTFYPEGGSMIAGALNKVAFKAIKSNGQAAEVTGALYDQEGNEAGTFASEHLGMGSFAFLPVEGARYYTFCQNDKGQTKRFDLPDALTNGYALSVVQMRDQIRVSVVQPVGASPTRLYLLAHTRGMVHLMDRWDHNKNVTQIQKEYLPSGVLHLVLFDQNLCPLSERLVFVHNNDQAQVVYKPDKENYERRSLVKNSVTITNTYNGPLTGSFSVSVTSDREVQPDTTANILTHLLLTSDLKGTIENPAYYFRNTTESERALDLLMCTQGWRRYHIAEVAQGNVTQPLIPLESESEISGVVTNASGKYLEDMEVDAIAFPSGFHFTTQTDIEGRFYLPVGDIPDSTSFLVSATLKRGASRVELLLDKERFPKITLPVIPPAGINKEHYSKYLDKIRQQYLLEHDGPVTLLQAAEVSAQYTPPQKSLLYKEVDYSFNEEELERFPPYDVVALLRRFPDIFVSRNEQGEYHIIMGQGNAAKQVFESGYRVGQGNAARQAFEKESLKKLNPLLLLDGVPLDIDLLYNIDPLHIAQIDILKPGARANIFGLAGSQGVIAIYTKKPDIYSSTTTPPLPHIKTLFPLGYQQPVEFYAPKYETPAQRNNPNPDLRTTIHWQPVVITNDRGIASFEFYSADEDASYTVTIQGLAHDGTIIFNEEKIGRR